MNGCGETAPQTPADPAQPVERTATRGPVTVTVRADKDRVTVGEKLTLTVDILAEPQVELKIPVLEESEAYEIHDRHTPPDVPDGEQRRWTHTYVLSTFDSGELETPSLTVPFTDRRDTPDAVSQPVQGEVSTEPLVITVVSLLGDDPDQAELRDIRGLVGIPSGRSLVLWIAGILIGAISIVLVVVLWRRGRRERESEAVAIPAHEWALAQLDRLEQDRLIDRNLVHEFFFRLSDIIRQYLERRFAISAPERTTQEFIREMRDYPVLSGEQQALLADFLRAADMVKFALHRPPRAESETALATARAFVKETSPPEGVSEGSGQENASEVAA